MGGILKHRDLVPLSAQPQTRCFTKLVYQKHRKRHTRSIVNALAGIEVYTAPVVSQLVPEGAVLTPRRLDTQPSKDLKELCTLQLGLLETLLKRSGKQGQLHAAVYLRLPGTDSLGLVQLQHIASLPDASAQQSAVQAVTQRADVCQAVSLDGWSPTDTCLMNEEVLVSPSNGLMVMPLVDKQVLVGLLLVDTNPSTDINTAMPHPTIQITQQTAELLSQPNEWSSQFSIPTQLQHQELQQHDSDVLSVQHQQLDDDAPSVQIQQQQQQQQQQQIEANNQQGLIALQTTAPLLAKACAMEHRSLLSKMAASSQAAAAGNLLQEAKRATQALSTFNAMLLPRIKDGTPDKDLARGIAIQEQRLRDILKQLNAALPPQYDRGLLDGMSIDSRPAEPVQATTIDMELDAQDSRIETTSIVSTTSSTEQDQTPLNQALE